MSKQLEFVDVTEKLAAERTADIETLQRLLLRAEYMHSESLRYARELSKGAREEEHSDTHDKLIAIAAGSRKTARKFRKRAAALRDLIEWRKQAL
jgi:hypothetical protein